MSPYLLAIDQGTTNSRAILFNRTLHVISEHSIPLKQFYPQNGWVEHDPEEMVENTILCCRTVLKKANVSAHEIASVGISNQRETSIIWDKQNGKPIYPAIVWQDRRTKYICDELAEKNLRALLQKKTGLLLHPYFSATKIMWLLEHVPFARERAEQGELLFGTVDTFLLWKLTNGEVHRTDATNASRTLLFNIHTQTWDSDILKMLQIPMQILPKVFDNVALFGEIHADILGSKVPIGAMAGDQQAATIGQACISPGMIKATYGTGCFMLLNTGNEARISPHLLSTVAYRLNGKVTYGLEGSAFCAGMIIKWLRDQAGLIKTAAETEKLAASVETTEGVYFLPALAGLGAPYWEPEARGVIAGLTLKSGREHIVRAALESVVYQTQDLLDAMLLSGHPSIRSLRVDGGMAANNWLLQFLSDILQLQIERPLSIETTALGVAYLAGLQAGMYQALEEIAGFWQGSATFLPIMSVGKRNTLHESWIKLLVKQLSH